MPATHAQAHDAASSGFDRRVERLDTLLQELETGSDPVATRRAHELVRTVMEMHRLAIDHLFGILDADREDLVDRLAGDPVVSSLLVLHGLHPVPLEARVERGLEDARPYLRSHGGNVELLHVDEAGRVFLRLHGTCHSCPSSSATLQGAIEGAVRAAAPEVDEIVIDSSPAEARGDAFDQPATTPGRHVALPIAAVQAGGR
jgi:Fe-S cluster biogenesis protein NfuA